MTDRAEIERLLQMTGRTLEGLPDDYGDEKLKVWRSFRDGKFGHVKSFEMANRILHQSDVIELLVGALRDALDKPIQKPLTLEELSQYEDELINSRTPEEIKERLWCCSKENGCLECPDVAAGDCSLKLCADALALIERLESERDAALAKVPR